MKRAIVVAVFLLPALLFSKPFMDFKSTGLFSKRGNVPLYYRTSVDLGTSVCSQMADSVKLGAALSVGTICEATCRRILNPDWFIPFVAAKKSKVAGPAAKTEYVTVPFESDWDKVVFCGWNPERGLSEKDIGQEGISNAADLAQANLLCKKGTDRHIIFVIGASSAEQCRTDCQKCSIPPSWKD